MTNLRAIGSGYLEVYVDGIKVSQHTTERNAAERAYNEKLARPSADVRYRQTLEVVLEGRFEAAVIEGMQTQAGSTMTGQ